LPDALSRIETLKQENDDEGQWLKKIRSTLKDEKEANEQKTWKENDRKLYRRIFAKSRSGLEWKVCTET
jgi:hypothetical protein